MAAVRREGDSPHVAFMTSKTFDRSRSRDPRESASCPWILSGCDGYRGNGYGSIDSILVPEEMGDLDHGRLFAGRGRAATPIPEQSCRRRPTRRCPSEEKATLKIPPVCPSSRSTGSPLEIPEPHGVVVKQPEQVRRPSGETVTVAPNSFATPEIRRSRWPVSRSHSPIVHQLLTRHGGHPGSGNVRHVPGLDSADFLSRLRIPGRTVSCRYLRTRFGDRLRRRQEP